MFKRKTTIALKLSLIIIIPLGLLIGIIIATQFFIVSRMYLTTEYTKERENGLLRELYWIEGIEVESNNDEKKITETLNRYAKRNTAYCFILDANYNIKYKSDNVSEINNTYISNMQKMFRNGEIPSSTFRIDGFLNIPSKYIGINSVLYSNSVEINERDNKENDTFVAVTEEVYTDDNYLVLQKYSIYIFSIAIIFVVILAVIFSHIITRPILKIRDTTARMTKLDFTKKCDYIANDEIGELSESINFLAEKLDDTIEQLKEANENLKGDLEVQREIDKLRKDFIASVSHEFKTPLTLIRGFNEVIMENRVSGEELHEAQNIIMDEVDRMDKLVQDLLELSKLESAAYELDESEFNCIDLLNSIAEKYTIAMKEKCINFHCEFGNEPVLVYADKSRIEQVVMNFITNALLNTKDEKTIILKTEVIGDVIAILVFNEGNHIIESEKEKIWDKFYRTDKSRSKKTGGTGLGLAICKEILEKHGSSYGVENIENGVEFYFTLKIIN